MKVIRAAFLVICFVSTLSCAGDNPPDSSCQETVMIDSVEYAVSLRWCGKKIDSALVADPVVLVRLPEELCFEASRIYVLPETRDAFANMAEAARKDSVELITDSGYRSASFQERIIKRRMNEGSSFENVIRFVAPPGYSQHETGRALDMVPSEARFVYTDAYQWLKVNASEYGFYETLPEDSTGETYWESWHWYYTGD